MNIYQENTALLANLNVKLNAVTIELYALYENETIDNELLNRPRKLELEAQELELERQMDVIYDAVDY